MSIKHKHCNSCDTTKDIILFHTNKTKNNGISIYCKECNNSACRNHKRTKVGLVSKIYASQRYNSKQRGYSQPTYSLYELREWLFSQKKFHMLFNNWKRLDYQKDYIPSVDRINDYIGYTMDNIQIMTWVENRNKHDYDVICGVNNKYNKKVRQYYKDGEFIMEYHSISEASRICGVDKANISSSCAKKRKTAGGFIWIYC